MLSKKEENRVRKLKLRRLHCKTWNGEETWENQNTTTTFNL